MRIHRKSTATYESVLADIRALARIKYDADMKETKVPSSWYARKSAICHSLGKYTDTVDIWDLEYEMLQKWHAARDAVEAWKIDNLRN